MRYHDTTQGKLPTKVDVDDDDEGDNDEEDSKGDASEKKHNKVERFRFEFD